MAIGLGDYHHGNGASITVQSPFAFGFGHYATIMERGTSETHDRIEYSLRICSERVPRVYWHHAQHNTTQAKAEKLALRSFCQAASGSALGRITLWGATGLRPCQCPFCLKVIVTAVEAFLTIAGYSSWSDKRNGLDQWGKTMWMMGQCSGQKIRAGTRHCQDGCPTQAEATCIE